MQDMQDGEGLDFEIELKTEGISGGTAKRTWQHPQPPSRIKQWLQQLLPPTCHDCRVLIPANAYAEAGTPFLCPECLRNLPWLVPAFSCQRCGNLTAEPMRQGCPQCFDSNWSLHQTIADLRYEGIVREWVLRCKFGRQDWLGPLLGRLMVLAQQQRPPLPPNVVLIPVPLHPNRIRKRGFNQALLLTHHLRNNLPDPKPEVRPEWLRRIRDTPPQTELPLEQRLRNPENAFAAAPEVRGCTVIVVDDVMTTGSTLNACARTLQAQGTQQVIAWVLGRRVHEPMVQEVGSH